MYLCLFVCVCVYVMARHICCTMARQVFVFPSEKPECDWNTDEMREISEKKARAWVRLKKFPNGKNLKVEYQRLKVLAKKTAECARNEWWKSKAEEAERMYEKAVKHGKGVSLSSNTV